MSPRVVEEKPQAGVKHTKQLSPQRRKEKIEIKLDLIVLCVSSVFSVVIIFHREATNETGEYLPFY
jgi:hypothetical protein